MASINEPAPTTESSPTHQAQAETRATSSMPDITQFSLEHSPDIFTIICCNDSFQLALDHSTIKALLRVCRHVQPLLSSKVARFHSWCQNAGLCNPDGQMRIGLTPSDLIAISLHCDDPVTADRSWLEDQADMGNAVASYFLARILQIDLAIDQSLEKSEQQAIRQRIFRHLEIAANTSHTMSQFHLTQCYYQGVGVDEDHTKAVDMFRSLAECGMAQAQVALGRCFESGEGVDQDYSTAIEWYSRAADQGSEDGRLHIVFLQAWFSFIGHGVEQSDVAALNHWQEVITQSTDPIIKPIATHMVGWMHYLGRGTQQDKQTGVRIIRENKLDGFELGEGVLIGFVASSNSPVSRKIFELCQLGLDRDWLCRHLMAVCVFHGFGTTEDRRKAAGIFEQLANEGHSDSQFCIGECYWRDWGVPKDYEKAFEWFSKSANQGNSYGQWRLGSLNCWGYGVTRDEPKAIEWCRKSAEQGNRYAQYWLGNRYKNGEGVPQDIDTAIFWYRKSADQGLDWAISSLKKLGKWP